MGHTIAEKILARCAGQARVSPGEYVWAGVDQTDADANHLRTLDQLGVKRLAAPDKVWVTSDHYAPATDRHYADQDNLLRRYVRQYRSHTSSSTGGTGSCTSSSASATRLA